MEWIIENEYLAKGFKVICGTDEAGRGPLCGNVVAGACVLPIGINIDGLNDSKKLSEKKREELFGIITEKAVAWAVGEASPKEIDEMNILNAAQTAMRRAVAKLGVIPELVLVDGNVARDFPIPAVAVIKGDALSPSIAAASILAKVTRDRELVALDKLYPPLGLAAHKGYPTKAHYAALNDYIDKNGAPPDFYRLSFLKKLHRQ